MKVILHMAATANGYIASSDGDTAWSFEELMSYSDAVNKAGNVVIGRRTYELMRMAGDFEKIAGQTVVVLTTRPAKEEGDFIFVNSPDKAIEVLRDKGFRDVLIGGGARCNSSFLKLGLIDEFYLNVEPFIFGAGVPLFFPEEFVNNLTLLEVKHLSKNVIQLHYRVSKD